MVTPGVHTTSTLEKAFRGRAGTTRPLI